MTQPDPPPRRQSWLSGRTGPAPNWLLLGGTVTVGTFLWIRHRAKVAAAAAASSNSAQAANVAATASPDYLTAGQGAVIESQAQAAQSAAAADAAQTAQLGTTVNTLGTKVTTQGGTLAGDTATIGNLNRQVAAEAATIAKLQSAINATRTTAPPAKTTGPPPAPAPARTYTVKPGDTLSKIAGMYGTTYQAIAAANGIANPNLIYPGQVLKV